MTSRSARWITAATVALAFPALVTTFNLATGRIPAIPLFFAVDALYIAAAIGVYRVRGWGRSLGVMLAVMSFTMWASSVNSPGVGWLSLPLGDLFVMFALVRRWPSPRSATEQTDRRLQTWRLDVAHGCAPADQPGALRFRVARPRSTD